MPKIGDKSGVQLVHGDCLDILPTLKDASVDFVITDPPYGHNNNNNGDLISRIESAIPNRRRRTTHTQADYAPRPIINDGAEANDLIRSVLPEINRILAPGACCCCCGGGGGPDPQFARWSLWMDEAIGFKQMVVWDKGPMGMGWHYRRSYETVLVGEKPGAACRWFDKSGRIENVIRPSRCPSQPRKIIPAADEHPTAKPVQLFEHFLRLHTRPGDLVVDPFMGGGASAVACVRLGRRYIGIELDKHWYDYSRARVDKALKLGRVE